MELHTLFPRSCYACLYHSSRLPVTVWLTGLSPSVLVYDAKVLVIYLFVLGIALIVLIALGVCQPELCTGISAAPPAGMAVYPGQFYEMGHT